LATGFGNNASIIVSAMASVALVIVTAALVLATLAYTEAASRQAEAMNRQAQAQEVQAKAADRQVTALTEQAKAADRQVTALTDPVVFFGVEEVAITDQFFVQNVGPGIAYDVSFKVLKDFEAAVLVADPGSADEKLSDLAFLKSTLKTLGPGQKMPFAIINPLHNKNMSKETIEVEVSYKNNIDAKKSFQQRFPIDFAYYKGLREVRETTADHIRRIAGSIQEIEKKLEKK
jgi:hypothetical protein